MPTIAEPLHLVPRLVPKPWGGRALTRFGRALPEGVRIGESWEVADLPRAGTSGVEDPCTRVAVGPFAGRSLGELLHLDPAGLLGDAAAVDQRFPVLVKLLDVDGPLSVQVHPDAGYVGRHPEVHAKTETWVVLDARPGSELLLGLAPAVSLDEVRAAAGTPRLLDLLQHVPARPGQVHHLPAGTPHGILGGVLLAEVQTPSDTTFRLYDWSADPERPPRPLHLEEGVEVLASVPAEVRDGRATATSLPLDAGAYRIHRHHLDVEVAREVPAGRLRVVLVAAGVLDGTDLRQPVAAGSTVVLPAAWAGELHAVQAADWLEVTLPRADET